MNRILGVSVVAAALGLLALAWSGGQDSSSGRPLELGRPTGQGEGPSSAVERERIRSAPRDVQEAPPETAHQSAEHTLRDYWGSDWPQVRESLLARGHDLEKDFSLAPWDEVADSIHDMGFVLPQSMREEKLRASVDWPEDGELTAEFLREKYSYEGEISGYMVGQASAIALSYNLQIEDGVRGYLDMMDDALEQAWLSDSYTRSPFAGIDDKLLSPQNEDRKTFYAGGWGGGGWHVHVKLYRDEHSAILDAQARVRAVRHQRDDEVSSLLRGG